MLYHIVAVARNGVIGQKNRLPWHFTEDLKHFKKITTGQTVIMGRKTFESLGKPLPGRDNFVLTRNTPPAPPQPAIISADGPWRPEANPDPARTPTTVPTRPGNSARAPNTAPNILSYCPALNSPARYFGTIDAALKSVRTPHAFIIGGEKLYRATIDRVDGIYLTRIDADYEGDAFYPAIPPAFKETSRQTLRQNPTLDAIYLSKGV